MDSCMTCQLYFTCPKKISTITGCSDWIPEPSIAGDKFDIRRSLDAGRPIWQGEPKDELSAASAFMLGFAVSLPIWIFIIWVIKAVFSDG